MRTRSTLLHHFATNILYYQSLKRPTGVAIRDGISAADRHPCPVRVVNSLKGCQIIDKIFLYGNVLAWTAKPVRSMIQSGSRRQKIQLPHGSAQEAAPA